MQAILRSVVVLSFIPAALCHSNRASLPVYFFASESAPTTCQVFGGLNSPRISSSRLDFSDGQRIDFLNAHSDVPCTPEDTENRLSVFTGHDPAKWHAHLPISRRIRFRSVYPGIDIVYYGQGSHLEYDFELAAGAAVSRIRLGFAENTRLKISPAGDLLVSIEGSTLTQHRPRVLQGGRDIAARYTIEGNQRQVRIELGRYDHSRPLTIDPVLAWQTSVHAANSGAVAVAVDAGGNMWMLASFARTAGYTNTFGPGGGAVDVTLLKVDPTGGQLLYAVLLGGSNTEIPSGLAIGIDGSAYIVGSTMSADFPVTPQAFQSSLPSVTGGAAFVTKLSPAGDSLIYSTYLGGSGGAGATGVVLDRAGNAFVTGTVTPPDFPVTAGSWETTFGVYPLSTPHALLPVAGGFVTKLNTTGTALLYSTLIEQRPEGLTLNSAGAAYILGEALAYLPPLSQYTLSLGSLTGNGSVITRLTPDGSRADLSIFLGCLVALSNGRLIALDSQNNILVAGSTTCSTFGAGTSGAFQPQHAPSTSATQVTPDDGLIVKIAPDASAVLAATFLGGSNMDDVYGLTVASDDSIVVAGGTSSSDFPVTADALQPKYGGGAIPTWNGDGFFAHLSPNLDRLLYSTYLGGGGTDSISAIALDLADNAYMGGFSASGLHTSGAFTFGGTGFLWALKLAHDASAPPTIASVSPAELTAGSAGSAIEITGTNFAQNAAVLVNGTSTAATWNNTTELTVNIAAANLTTTGSLELRVLNPGSAASNAVLLPITAPAGSNPSPHIGTLLPNGLPAGSHGQNIIVTGDGLLASTVATVNGNPRTATLNADNSLSVSLTDADLSSAGVLSLTLTNPAPGGGVSAPASFLVSAGLVPLPAPALSSIGPAKMPAGTAATLIGFTASGLSPSAVARWNGVDHTISTDASGHRSFTASAADLAHAGTAEVTVYDPTSGLESNPLPFWIPFADTCTDIAWNASNSRIYLAETSSIVILNPATGDAEATIPVDISINRLAVSPDGSYVFAASSSGILRRYQVLSAAPWLGNALDLQLSSLVDFTPVPGSPGSVAVYTNTGPNGAVAIYDGSVKRSATAQMSTGTAARALQFSADGQTLWYAVGGSSVSLTTMPVTSAGVGTAVTKTAGSAVNTSTAARYFQGRIYTSSGLIFDGTTLTRVGAVPASGPNMPLVNQNALVILNTARQDYCSLQAFDPVSLLPLWEEHMAGPCDSIYYPYSDLFDTGAAIAFRTTKAYILRKPAPAPLHSIYLMNSVFNPTLEIGANWGSDDELAVLSKQNTLPVTAFLMPDQAGVLSVGTAYPNNQYLPSVTPAAFSFAPQNLTVGQYTGNLAILISNTTNTPLQERYQISMVNPYPLQASVNSLSFTWQIGTPAPPSQSFLLTKKGESIAAALGGTPYPSWLVCMSGSGVTPETITVSVNPAGLSAGTYTANVTMGYYSTSSGSLVVPVTLTVIAGVNPSVTSVQDAESTNLTVVPGEWVAIYGTNLAATTRTWAASDFGSGNALPTVLDGVSVRFGGTPAAIYYVSPTQIDAQVPSGLSGSVPVVVTLNGATSAAATATVATHAPSLFVYGAGSNLYPAALHSNGTLIGDPALQAGSSEVKPGETIVLYVNGLGASPGGQPISTPVPYTDPVAVAIGSEDATVSYAGLVAPGQFQLNVQVPGDLAAGNYPTKVTAGGQVSPGTVLLPVQ